MIIRKKIIFYKNLIFFKIVLYSLATLAFTILSPLLGDKLEHASLQLTKLKKDVSTLKDRYHSIQNIKQDNSRLETAYQLLQKINSRPLNYTCFINDSLRQQYSQFTQKYNLPSPIKINFVPSNILPPKSYNNKHLTLKDTIVNLEFKIDSFDKVVTLIEDAEQSLPEQNAILSFEADMQDIINPSNLSTQGGSSVPIFIVGNVKMRFSEIINQKK